MWAPDNCWALLRKLRPLFPRCPKQRSAANERTGTKQFCQTRWALPPLLLCDGSDVITIPRASINSPSRARQPLPSHHHDHQGSQATLIRLLPPIDSAIYRVMAATKGNCLCGEIEYQFTGKRCRHRSACWHERELTVWGIQGNLLSQLCATALTAKR